jgi:hypothetical protein
MLQARQMTDCSRKNLVSVRAELLPEIIQLRQMGRPGRSFCIQLVESWRSLNARQYRARVYPAVL